MEITYLGHSCFRLKGKSAILVTDPFNPAVVGLPFKNVTGDIITVSHQHEDHNFVDAVSNVRKVIDAPGEYEISGISIIGLPSYHDDKKGKIRGKNIIFVIEIDGLRLAHLGDLGYKLSETEIESLGSIDILMVPTGGEYTIGSADAAQITRAIDPYIIIPMHYQVKGLKKVLFDKLSSVEPFLEDMGVGVERIDKLIVKKESLTEEQKIVVLERKS